MASPHKLRNAGLVLLGLALLYPAWTLAISFLSSRSSRIAHLRITFGEESNAYAGLGILAELFLSTMLGLIALVLLLTGAVAGRANPNAVV